MQIGRADRQLESLAAAAPEVSVDQVAADIRTVTRLSLFALKRSETVLDPAELRALQRQLMVIRTRVQAIDAAFASRLVGARSHVDPYDLLHYDQIVARREPGGPCPRCGTTETRLTYGVGEPAAEARIGLFCDVLRRAQRGAGSGAVAGAGAGRIGAARCAAMDPEPARKG